MSSSAIDALPPQVLHLLGACTPNLSPHVKLTVQPCANHPNSTLLDLSPAKHLSPISTGQFDKPRFHLSWRPKFASQAETTHFLGFQCTEFALPVRAKDASLHFDFFNRSGFTRPRSLLPLLVMSTASDECVLLAPVQSFHEQVLAVADRNEQERELQWGWCGDLDVAPPGFSTTLAVICGTSPRGLIHTWAQLVRKHAADKGLVLNNCGRYADVSSAKLSMWTDNGAAYWYRTEKGMDFVSTLESTVQNLEQIQVPIHCVELDSWFYRHEITRPVVDVGYVNVVPPTGMLRWEPREDILGKGGIKDLRQRVGNRPLILHSRHISSKSSYIQEPSLENEKWWIDSDRAHPEGSALFRKWMQQASDWGASTYEQDWISEVWLGVRQLREEPGRIARWQSQLNNAAKEQNISLIWCMATPADMAHAVQLQQVVAVRSCDDYRYTKDPSILWRWNLIVSCLIRDLGLFPFKDVFMSHTNNSMVPNIEGDPHAELEACLAALSAGPVGIGDRLGRTNRDLVMKTCRVDGVLIKPDLPLAALDRSFRNANGFIWAQTHSGLWKYLVVIRPGIKSEDLSEFSMHVTEDFKLNQERVLAYDWRKQTASVVTELEAKLLLHEWKLWILCPVHTSSLDDVTFALIGDRNAFATLGDRRFRIESSMISEEKLRFDVVGVHGEEVDVTYWSSISGVTNKKIHVPAKGWTHCSLQVQLGDVVLTCHE